MPNATTSLSDAEPSPRHDLAAQPKIVTERVSGVPGIERRNSISLGCRRRHGRPAQSEHTPARASLAVVGVDLECEHVSGLGGTQLVPGTGPERDHAVDVAVPHRKNDRETTARRTDPPKCARREQLPAFRLGQGVQHPDLRGKTVGVGHPSSLGCGRLVGQGRKTTPREPMEPGLQLSDEVLRQTLDAAPDGMIVVDPSGTILFVNQMVEQLFGYEHDELMGMSVDLLLPAGVRALHTGRRAEYAEHPRRRAMGTGLDLRGRRRSGSEFPLEISLSPLRTDAGLLVVAIIRDITERRTADDELERAHQVLALVDDRERIARDLHDTVIQRLFAVGLSLQAALTRAANDDPARERVELAIDEIDMTIRDIRSSIFALHTRRPLGVSLRDEVLTIAREAARALGFEPSVAFDGPVDTLATDEIREHVLATLREALSNVTKHAQASFVGIVVEADAKQFCVRIRDNGVGMGNPREGNGLRNMSERAMALGGRCELDEPSDEGGTRIDWRIPLAVEPS